MALNRQSNWRDHINQLMLLLARQWNATARYSAPAGWSVSCRGWRAISLAGVFLEIERQCGDVARGLRWHPELDKMRYSPLRPGAGNDWLAGLAAANRAGNIPTKLH